MYPATRMISWVSGHSWVYMALYRLLSSKPEMVEVVEAPRCHPTRCNSTGALIYLHIQHYGFVINAYQPQHITYSVKINTSPKLHYLSTNVTTSLLCTSCMLWYSISLIITFPIFYITHIVPHSGFPLTTLAGNFPVLPPQTMGCHRPHRIRHRLVKFIASQINDISIHNKPLESFETKCGWIHRVP